MVGDGSYQQLWKFGGGRILPTALNAADPLGWVRIWCLHGSRPARSLPQQKGLDERSGRVRRSSYNNF